MRDMQATFSGIFGENKKKNWEGNKRNAITLFLTSKNFFLSVNVKRFFYCDNNLLYKLIFLHILSLVTITVNVSRSTSKPNILMNAF